MSWSGVGSTRGHENLLKRWSGSQESYNAESVECPTLPLFIFPSERVAAASPASLLNRAGVGKEVGVRADDWFDGIGHLHKAITLRSETVRPHPNTGLWAGHSGAGGEVKGKN